MAKVWCKRLDTGQRALQNVGEKGRDFITMQPKPVIGADGKLYKDGVWVVDTKPLSKEAKKIVTEATDPAKTEAISDPVQ